MAKTKQYFGENETATNASRRAKRGRPAKTETATRKYTKRRAARKASNSEREQNVTIEVPASLAFQVGVAIGQANRQFNTSTLTIN